MTDKLVLPKNWIAVPKRSTHKMLEIMGDYRTGGIGNGNKFYRQLTAASPPCPVLPYAEVRRKVLEEARDAVAKSPFLRAHRGHYIDIIDALIDGEPT